jgi:hypothetical protein
VSQVIHAPNLRSLGFEDTGDPLPNIVFEPLQPNPLPSEGHTRTLAGRLGQCPDPAEAVEFAPRGANSTEITTLGHISGPRGAYLDASNAARRVGRNATGAIGADFCYGST